jgi:dTDP-4-dehydrorhamnose reductase
MFIRDSGCKYYIIRTSWLYSEYGDNCFTRIASYLKDDKELKGANDIISSPTYARDLVHFICHIIEKENVTYGIYHFTNEGVCTRYDFMYIIDKELSTCFHVLKPVSNDIFKCPAKRPYCSVLSKAKARQEYQILSWQEALLDCITNYRALKTDKNAE